jgi:hypothetical protein
VGRWNFLVQPLSNKHHAHQCVAVDFEQMQAIALTDLALTVLAQFDQACLKGHEKRVMVEAVCLAVGHFREEDFLQGATKKSSLSRMLWQVI